MKPHGGLHPIARSLALVLLFASGAFASGGVPLLAQEPLAWRAWSGVGVQTFDSDDRVWEDWLVLSAGIQRQLRWGVLGVKAFRSERFSLCDEGAAVNVYVDTWDRAYAHVRAQVVPDARVLPSSDVRLELFQGLEGGWEVSLAARRMMIAGDPLHVVSGSLARYLPAWYLRGRIDVTPSSDETAVSVGGVARRSLSAIEGMIELAAGAGREVVDIGAGPLVDIRRSIAVAARLELFPWPRLGFAAGASYAALDALPARSGGDLTVLVRW